MPPSDLAKFQSHLTELLNEGGVPYRQADSIAGRATEGWTVTRAGRLDDDKQLPADEIVEEHWPYDGPHSPETVTSAAYAVERLVRYINNATGPWNAEHTLAFAATSGRVLGDINAAVYGLRQLLDQQQIALEKQAGNPTLFDDRRDRPGSQTAREAIDRIARAKTALGDLTDRLDDVLRATTHLGNDE